MLWSQIGCGAYDLRQITLDTKKATEVAFYLLFIESEKKDEKD